MTRASPLTSTASFVEFDEAEPPGVLNVEYDTYEMPVTTCDPPTPTPIPRRGRVLVYSQPPR